MKKVKVLYVSSEVEPFAKTGGLGDVAGALPGALNRAGVDARVIMPRYGFIPDRYQKDMEYLGYVYVDLGWRHQYCALMKLEYGGVTCYFIDNEYYFKRGGLYGYNDEAERFVFFSKAVVEILKLTGFRPDIVHCNDWQTGIISVLLKEKAKSDDYYQGIKTVFTIHNLKYQGVFSKEILNELLNIGWEYFTPDGLEFYDNVNLLKAGLVYADIITTVSKTYAKEILDDFFAESLGGVLNRRKGDLHGILNGIDYERYDPMTDKALFLNYDRSCPENKTANKLKLQADLGLAQDDSIPVLGLIARLTSQKGLDLVKCVLGELLEQDLQLVVLGVGERQYEDMFLEAQRSRPGKVSASIRFDEALARGIYAGSDMFLVPSLFEPCGLTQLYALRYGTVPIVRETGGLKDTVKNYNSKTGKGNGFTFINYNAHEMLFAVKKALDLYTDRDAWDTIVKNGMGQDFSWDKSARAYKGLYRKLLG